MFSDVVKIEDSEDVQFGWIDWGKNNQKLRIPGTGILRWDYNEYSEPKEYEGVIRSITDIDYMKKKVDALTESSGGRINLFTNSIQHVICSTIVFQCLLYSM